MGGDSSKKHHRRHERTSSLQALDRLNTKIQCTKESIRKEQTARDGNYHYHYLFKIITKVLTMYFVSLLISDNVNEYLKLAASADKQQLQRIKVILTQKNYFK